MNKLDAIKKLKENGIFELTQEIIDIINSDESETHASANKDVLDLITRVHQMQNWTLFNWKNMIDFTTQAFGFVKYADYNKLDVCSDVVDQIEELHTLLWNNFSSMSIWS